MGKALHYCPRSFGIYNLSVSVVQLGITVRHRHSIDCLLAIGLALVVAAVKDNSLQSGSKAELVALHGLVLMYKNRYAIRLSGFVPR